MDRDHGQHGRRLTPWTLFLLLLVTALPAGADNTGVVDATVTVTGAEEACILVGVNSISFGTLDFGTSGFSVPYLIDKCSEVSQDLYVHGTDASLPSGSWPLTDTWPPGLNEYNLDARGWGSAAAFTDLSSMARLHTSAMPMSSSGDHFLTMPAPGSFGAGEIASFQIVWIAVISD